MATYGGNGNDYISINGEEGTAASVVIAAALKELASLIGTVVCQ